MSAREHEKTPRVDKGSVMGKLMLTEGEGEDVVMEGVELPEETSW